MGDGLSRPVIRRESSMSEKIYTIDEIKMSQDFQNFEKWRNKQSVKKKMQYYKD